MQQKQITLREIPDDQPEIEPMFEVIETVNCPEIRIGKRDNLNAVTAMVESGEIDVRIIGPNHAHRKDSD